MRKILIGIGVVIMALPATTVTRTGQEAGKLPKCSGQLCQRAGCSPDVLCARGASVETCAEVCGGH